jgi:antitoxin (DNA-binding transcriptional repressor) of toxin-antitoxin stability system
MTMTIASKTVSLDEAPGLLPELVRVALRGGEVILTEAGAPVARIVPAVMDGRPRIPGLSEGEAWISDDFDAELPDAFWFGEE